MSSEKAGSSGKCLQLSEYLAVLVRNKGFSGSVLVTEKDEILLRAGYGMANIELQVPNTPETIFRIGSVTKQFTAMAIMVLAEQGKVSLDDRLIDRVTGLPEGWSDIRVRHLLNHTSGIMHSWSLPDFMRRSMVPFPLEAIVEEIRKKPLLFAPGAGCQYSGIGYFLLARIIERASGQTYESFLRTTIFDPLGMADTGGDNSVPILPRRAAGYARGDGVVDNAEYGRVDGVVQNAAIVYTPNLTGGGNLYSTVDDLARWDRALNAGRLISPGSYQVMYTPGRDGYGYGWKVSQIDNERVIEHGGGVNGFRCQVRRIPERKIGVFILSNDESTDGYMKEMLGYIHTALLGTR